MNYLMDTDWAIAAIRRSPRALKEIERRKPDGIAVSIVTVAELYAGVFLYHDPVEQEARVEAFIAEHRVLNLNQAITRIFGQQRARLQRAGNLIRNMDLLIGSTAIHHNLTVLTNNRRDFERIQPLRIESFPR